MIKKLFFNKYYVKKKEAIEKSRPYLFDIQLKANLFFAYFIYCF